jgi:hypothetical protein
MHVVSPQHGEVRTMHDSGSLNLTDEFKTIGPSRKDTHIAEVKFLIPGEKIVLPLTAELLA